MNGLKVLMVVVLLGAISALTEGRAAKRDQELDGVVRALRDFVARNQEKKEAPQKRQELTAAEVQYNLNRLEDELFLEKMMETQASYSNICYHLMGWLYAHDRARNMAEADAPQSGENGGGQSAQVRGLLKRVLFRLSRSSNATNTSASVESSSSESVESTASPESSESVPESVEKISDESDETIEEEEDGLYWKAYLTSCWMWELALYGTAPEYPYWLWTVY